jgi:hypothetical protein
LSYAGRFTGFNKVSKNAFHLLSEDELNSIKTGWSQGTKGLKSISIAGLVREKPQKVFRELARGFR